jgi:hypothetical protein
MPAKKIKLPKNFGTKPKTLKGYNAKASLGGTVVVSLNRKIIHARISRISPKNKRWGPGTFKTTIKGVKYQFKPKGPGTYVTLRLLKKSKSKTSKTSKKSKTSKRGKKSKKVTTRRRRTVGGSKRVSTKRKSPEESATLFPVGKVKTGNDGNRWVVKKASNGVKRWIKK